MDRLKIPYKRMAGEGAFYGPKIDIKLIDAIGRSWQLTTVQFDFNLPARFGLEYVGDDGARHQPLMVHRALLGSVERFFGILIEHYAGAFPLWLAPVQVEICPVSEKVKKYAEDVYKMLKNHGIRVHLDDRNEKLPAKIRDAQLQKIPYMLVVGPKEAEAGTVSVRHRSKGDLGPKPLADLAESPPQRIRLPRYFVNQGRNDRSRAGRGPSQAYGSAGGIRALLIQLKLPSESYLPFLVGAQHVAP